MICPKCNEVGVEELADEVDIGVGIIRHVFGLECRNCGEIGICGTCGAFDFQPHKQYCGELKALPAEFL